MSFKIKLLPDAHLDIVGSINWYNEQKPGLGKRFYECVKSQLNHIKNNPLHYKVIYRDTRNALVNKFPFQVHYRIEETRKFIIVFGVTHTNRAPKIQKKRN